MKKLIIGLDNGVSGTIGVIGDEVLFFKTPTKSELEYTKKKANVTRIDYKKLKETLEEICSPYDAQEIIVALERPMVNPGRFVATKSALRAWEATLICLEELGLPYMFIDSKEWQKEVLPKGVLGGAELKKASKNVGDRLYPMFKDVKHEDRDGLLIAEYLRKTYSK